MVVASRFFVRAVRAGLAAEPLRDQSGRSPITFAEGTRAMFTVRTRPGYRSTFLRRSGVRIPSRVHVAAMQPGTSFMKIVKGNKMKMRRVFSTPDMPTANRAILAARHAGIADEHITLIARSDIEMNAIPDDRLNASSDFVPAALRGVGTGGSIGLVAGLVAMTIPAVGITVAGAALISLASAAVAGWSAALMGSAVPNDVRQKFEAEIESGRILVVVDQDAIISPDLDGAMTAAGALPLPFESPSALA
jgi:hypothetical protein